MAGFVLTAEIQMRGPRDLSRVVRDIRSSLSAITIPIDVKVPTDVRRRVEELSSSLSTTRKAATEAAGGMKDFGRSAALAAKRFAGFTIATAGFLTFTRALKNGVGNAIEFERELIKISQVTGKSTKQLKGLTSEVTALSKEYGVAANSILGVSRVLAQVGLSAREVTKALGAITRTELTATFGDIAKTTEGAVAILRQFGKGVDNLEAQLSSINAVSKRFAVESEDIIAAVRRTGGVFKAAGGSLNEFIALFTSVRATTRETAETIATGLRTIFTRIQRPQTIAFLKDFGIKLTDLEGNFVGPFEAVKRLSKALESLPRQSQAFAKISEQLGGFRQIGKVIPLLQQFTLAEQAIGVAARGTAANIADAEKAKKSLAVQISRVKEEFGELTRKLTDSGPFRTMVDILLRLSSAFIKVADTLTPLLPMLSTLATIKLGGALTSFGTGFAGGLRNIRGARSGGRVRGFARGGMVPGSGSGDTVPAMLEPGEFVIKKSSVRSIGSSNLERMNRRRRGGRIQRMRRGGRKSRLISPVEPAAFKGGKEVFGAKEGKTKGTFEANASAAASKLEGIGNNFGVIYLRPKGLKQQLKGSMDYADIFADMGKGKIGKQFKTKAGGILKKKFDFNLKGMGLPEETAEGLERSLYAGVTRTITKAGSGILKQFGQKKRAVIDDKFLKNMNIDQVVGNLFEGVLARIGLPFDKKKEGPNALFDFPTGTTGSGLENTFKGLEGIPTDAKSSATRDNLKSMLKKVKGHIVRQAKRQGVGESLEELFAKRKAKGITGGVVPRTNLIAALGIHENSGPKEIKSALSDAGMGDEFDEVKRGQHIDFVRKAMGGRIPRMRTGGRRRLDPALSGGRGSGNPFAAMGRGKQFLKENVLPKDKKEAAIDAGLFAMPGGVAILGAKYSYKAVKALMQKRKGKSLKEEGKALEVVAAARGGKIDTAPALLTPGEFVINKSSAQSIGYGKLNRMNQVGKYAKGGRVTSFGPQRFQTGGAVGRGADIAILASTLIPLVGQMVKFSTETQKTVDKITQIAVQAGVLTFAFKTVATSGGRMGKSLIEAAKAAKKRRMEDKKTGRESRKLRERFREASEAFKRGFGRERAAGGGLMAATRRGVQGGAKSFGGIARAGAKFAQSEQAGTAAVTGFAAGLAMLNVSMQESAEAHKKVKEAAIAAGDGQTAANAAIKEAANERRKIETNAAAGAGALIGSFFGPVGTAVGGLVGALVGYTGVVGALRDQLPGGKLNRETEEKRIKLQAKEQAAVTRKAKEGERVRTEGQIIAQTPVADKAKQEERVLLHQLKERALAEKQAGANVAIFEDKPEQLANAITRVKTAEADRLKSSFAVNTSLLNHAKSLAALGKTEQEVNDTIIPGYGRLGDALKENAGLIGASSQQLDEHGLARAGGAEAQEATNKLLDANKETLKSHREHLARAATAAAAAAALFVQSQRDLKDLAKIRKHLSDFGDGSKRATASMNQTLALLKGGQVKAAKFIGRPEIEGDIKNISDRPAFEAQVTELGKVIGVGGDRLAKKFIEGSKVMDGLDVKLKDIGKDLGFGEKVGANMGNEIDKELDKVLGGISDPALKAAIQAQLREELIKASGEGLDDIEVAAIIDKTIKKQLDPIQKTFGDADKKLRDVVNGYIGGYEQVLNAQLNLQKRVLALVDLEFKGRQRIARATGKDIELPEVRRMTTGRRNIALAGTSQAGRGAATPANIASIAKAAAAAAQRAKVEQDAAEATAADTKQSTKHRKAALDASNEFIRLQGVLKSFGDVTQEVTAVQSRLAKVQSERQTRRGFVSQFTFGSNEQRRNTLQSRAATMRLAQTGDISSIPEQLRAGAKGLLDQFKDVRLPEFGGRTGDELSKIIEANAARQMGASEEMVQAILSRMPEEKKLINDLKKLNEQEQTAAIANLALEAMLQQQLYQNLNAHINQLRNLGFPGGGLAPGGQPFPGAGGAGGATAMFSIPPQPRTESPADRFLKTAQRPGGVLDFTSRDSGDALGDSPLVGGMKTSVEVLKAIHDVLKKTLDILVKVEITMTPMKAMMEGLKKSSQAMVDGMSKVGSMPEFHSGGVVPGPRGKEVISKLKSKEVVLSEKHLGHPGMRDVLMNAGVPGFQGGARIDPKMIQMMAQAQVYAQQVIQQQQAQAANQQQQQSNLPVSLAAMGNAGFTNQDTANRYKKSFSKRVPKLIKARNKFYSNDKNKGKRFWTDQPPEQMTPRQRYMAGYGSQSTSKEEPAGRIGVTPWSSPKQAALQASGKSGVTNWFPEGSGDYGRTPEELEQKAELENKRKEIEQSGKVGRRSVSTVGGRDTVLAGRKKRGAWKEGVSPSRIQAAKDIENRIRLALDFGRVEEAEGLFSEYDAYAPTMGMFGNEGGADPRRIAAIASQIKRYKDEGGEGALAKRVASAQKRHKGKTGEELSAYYGGVEGGDFTTAAQKATASAEAIKKNEALMLESVKAGRFSVLRTPRKDWKKGQPLNKISLAELPGAKEVIEDGTAYIKLPGGGRIAAHELDIAAREHADKTGSTLTPEQQKLKDSVQWNDNKFFDPKTKTVKDTTVADAGQAADLAALISLRYTEGKKGGPTSWNLTTGEKVITADLAKAEAEFRKKHGDPEGYRYETLQESAAKVHDRAEKSIAEIKGRAASNEMAGIKHVANFIEVAKSQIASGAATGEGLSGSSQYVAFDLVSKRREELEAELADLKPSDDKYKANKDTIAQLATTGSLLWAEVEAVKKKSAAQKDVFFTEAVKSEGVQGMLAASGSKIKAAFADRSAEQPATPAEIATWNKKRLQGMYNKVEYGKGSFGPSIKDPKKHIPSGLYGAFNAELENELKTGKEEADAQDKQRAGKELSPLEQYKMEASRRVGEESTKKTLREFGSKQKAAEVAEENKIKELKAANSSSDVAANLEEFDKGYGMLGTHKDAEGGGVLADIGRGTDQLVSGTLGVLGRTARVATSGVAAVGGGIGYAFGQGLQLAHTAQMASQDIAGSLSEEAMILAGKDPIEARKISKQIKGALAIAQGGVKSGSKEDKLRSTMISEFGRTYGDYAVAGLEDLGGTFTDPLDSPSRTQEKFDEYRKRLGGPGGMGDAGVALMTVAGVTSDLAAETAMFMGAGPLSKASKVKMLKAISKAKGPAKIALRAQYAARVAASAPMTKGAEKFKGMRFALNKSAIGTKTNRAGRVAKVMGRRKARNLKNFLGEKANLGAEKAGNIVTTVKNRVSVGGRDAVKRAKDISKTMQDSLPDAQVVRDTLAAGRDKLKGAKANVDAFHNAKEVARQTKKAEKGARTGVKTKTQKLKDAFPGTTAAVGGVKKAAGWSVRQTGGRAKDMLASAWAKAEEISSIARWAGNATRWTGGKVKGMGNFLLDNMIKKPWAKLASGEKALLGRGPGMEIFSGVGKAGRKAGDTIDYGLKRLFGGKSDDIIRTAESKGYGRLDEAAKVEYAEQFSVHPSVIKEEQLAKNIIEPGPSAGGGRAGTKTTFGDDAAKLEQAEEATAKLLEQQARDNKVPKKVYNQSYPRAKGPDAVGRLTDAQISKITGGRVTESRLWQSVRQSEYNAVINQVKENLAKARQTESFLQPGGLGIRGQAAVSKVTQGELNAVKTATVKPKNVTQFQGWEKRLSNSAEKATKVDAKVADATARVAKEAPASPTAKKVAKVAKPKTQQPKPVKRVKKVKPLTEPKASYSAAENSIIDEVKAATGLDPRKGGANIDFVETIARSTSSSAEDMALALAKKGRKSRTLGRHLKDMGPSRINVATTGRTVEQQAHTLMEETLHGADWSAGKSLAKAAGKSPRRSASQIKGTDYNKVARMFGDEGRLKQLITLDKGHLPTDPDILAGTMKYYGKPTERFAKAARLFYSGKGGQLKKILGPEKFDELSAILKSMKIGDKPVGFAAGGKVFGRFGIDTIPAYLTRGEAVVNEGQQAALAGMAGGSVGSVFGAAGVPGFAGNAANTGPGAQIGMRVSDAIRQANPRDHKASTISGRAGFDTDMTAVIKKYVRKKTRQAGQPLPEISNIFDSYGVPRNQKWLNSSTGGWGTTDKSTAVMSGPDFRAWAGMFHATGLRHFDEMLAETAAATKPEAAKAPSAAKPSGAAAKPAAAKEAAAREAAATPKPPAAKPAAGGADGAATPRQAAAGAAATALSGPGGLAGIPSETFRATVGGGLRQDTRRVSPQHDVSESLGQLPITGYPDTGTRTTLTPTRSAAAPLLDQLIQAQQGGDYAAAEKRGVKFEPKEAGVGYGGNGDSGSGDVSNIQTIVSELLAGISDLGKQVTGAAGQLANFTMQHEHNHSGSINIQGVDAAKKAISDAVIGDVKTAIDMKIDDLIGRLQQNDSGGFEVGPSQQGP